MLESEKEKSWFRGSNSRRAHPLNYHSLSHHGTVDFQPLTPQEPIQPLYLRLSPTKVSQLHLYRTFILFTILNLINGFAMNSERSTSVVGRSDVEIYNQIYHLHPHVANKPDSSVEDLLDTLYPPIDLVTLPVTLPSQMDVRQQPQMSVMARNLYLSSQLVSATPLALFGPGHYTREPRSSSS